MAAQGRQAELHPPPLRLRRPSAGARLQRRLQRRQRPFPQERGAGRGQALPRTGGLHPGLPGLRADRQAAGQDLAQTVRDFTVDGNAVTITFADGEKVFVQLGEAEPVHLVLNGKAVRAESYMPG